jgi:hypothetical protein
MQVFRYAHILGLIALLALSQTAFGHGFGLSLNGNKIEAHSEVPTISPHLFVEVLNTFSSTTMFSDHGGVAVDTGSGINVPPDTLSVEFLGPLWYSNGGAAQRAPAGVTLNATSFGAVMGSPVNLTGSSNNPGSFPVVGDDDHSIGWILFGSSVPPGAYGFGYRVTGLKGGNPLTPFEPSVPLVVVFSTPDFTGGAGGSLGNAQSAIFNAVLQGDFNQDGKATAADINVMLQALTDLNAYASASSPLHPTYPFALTSDDLLNLGDVNLSGSVTNADIQAELDLLGSMGFGSVGSVPEPAGWLQPRCLAGSSTSAPTAASPVAAAATNDPAASPDMLRFPSVPARNGAPVVLGSS